MAKKKQKEQVLVPELRFPEFEQRNAWDREFGNQLFTQINDRDHHGDLPVLAITQEHGAIPRGLIDYNVSVSQSSIDNYKVVRIGDFIISLRSFQGGIEFSQYTGLCSPAYVILREKRDTDTRFFKHLFKSQAFIRELTKNLEGLRDGKMISYKQFSDVAISLPSKAEQREIADCLGSLDDLIAAHRAKLDALQDHKKGLLQQLFPAEGEAKPTLRFPRFNEKWRSKKLEEHCSAKISYGIVQAGPHVPNGMPYIKSTDLNSPLCLSSLQCTSDRIAKRYRRSEVLPGDLVFSLRGNIGVARIVPNEISVANLTQGTARIRTKGPTEFYLYALQTDCVRKRILAVSKGSTFQEISLGDLRRIPILYPREDEQQRIAHCLSRLDALIAFDRGRIEVLNELKLALSQRLFPNPELRQS